MESWEVFIIEVSAESVSFLISRLKKRFHRLISLMSSKEIKKMSQLN